ncbi:MAG TPA: hypothetical protein VKG85_00705 [Actinomycetes bacterium]|nr:hypothetical protein [Actinomycetes bacterium]
MPCYRCGARQVDPVRGPSPWKRGVRAGAQVLVCPDCQQGPQWLAELDHCTRCGSEQLARILGETLCRACGKQGAAIGAPVADAAAGSPSAGSATGPVALPEQRAAASGAAASGSGAGTGAPAGAAAGTDLSAEVADALDRIFHRK